MKVCFLVCIVVMTGLCLAPSEHYKFVMDGLIKLRQATNKKWPGQWLWRWTFDPDAILCQQFAYFLAGEDVPFSRNYCSPNPAEAPYKIYDPNLPEFQSKGEGPSNSVPSVGSDTFSCTELHSRYYSCACVSAEAWL